MPAPAASPVRPGVAAAGGSGRPRAELQVCSAALEQRALVGATAGVNAASCSGGRLERPRARLPCCGRGRHSTAFDASSGCERRRAGPADRRAVISCIHGPALAIWRRRAQAAAVRPLVACRARNRPRARRAAGDRPAAEGAAPLPVLQVQFQCTPSLDGQRRQHARPGTTHRRPDVDGSVQPGQTRPSCCQPPEKPAIAPNARLRVRGPQPCRQPGRRRVGHLRLPPSAGGSAQHQEQQSTTGS